MGVRARMRTLNMLLGIRFGPGAATLPPSIKRIHLAFAYNWNNGHLGPRRFWRECLPRLKYHNPMVSMTVQRTTDQATKPIMTIHFDDSTSKNIDMQNKLEPAILEEFIKATGAKPIVPNAEEAEQLKEMEEQKLASERDRVNTQRYLDKIKEDKMLLERARQSVS